MVGRMGGPTETVSLRITLRYRSLDEFVERHGDHVSSAGVFIRTRSPKPVGTRVRFELLLSDGTTGLAGAGVVVHGRTDNEPGMALRFSELSEHHRATVDRMVETSGQGRLAPTPLDLRLPGSTTDLTSAVGLRSSDLSASWSVSDYSGISKTGSLDLPKSSPPAEIKEPVEAHESPTHDLPSAPAREGAATGPGSEPPLPEASTDDVDVDAAQRKEKTDPTFALPEGITAPDGADPAASAAAEAAEAQAEPDQDQAIDAEVPPATVAPAEEPQDVDLMFEEEVSYFGGGISTADAPSEFVAPTEAQVSFPVGLPGTAVEPTDPGMHPPTLVDARPLQAPPEPEPPSVEEEILPSEPIDTDDLTDPGIPPPGAADGPDLDLAARDDLPAEARRAVGLSFGNRTMRLGAFVRSEFSWISPASGASTVVDAADDALLVVASAGSGGLPISPLDAVLESADTPEELAGIHVLRWRGHDADLDVGAREVSLQQLLERVGQEAKALCERRLRDAPYQVFVSLPALTPSGSADFVLKALRSAGLPVERIHDPVEVSVAAFSLDDKRIENALVAIIEESGTRISILSRRGAELEVLGDSRLGELTSTRIDDKIVSLAVTSLLENTGEDVRSDPQALEALRRATLGIRSELRRSASVELLAAFHHHDRKEGLPERRIPLPRSHIYAEASDALDDFRRGVATLLREVDLDPRTLGACILTGDGAWFPPFRDHLAELSEREPLVSSPPHAALVQGLAKLGRNAEQQAIAKRPDTLDASIGIEIPGGRFKVLVPAGAKLPVRVHRVQPLRSGTTSFELQLLQGDGEMAHGCEELGRLKLDDVESTNSGVRIEMDLAVNEQGVLKATLSDGSSGSEVSGAFATQQAADEVRRELRGRPVSASMPNAQRGGLLNRLFRRP